MQRILCLKHDRISFNFDIIRYQGSIHTHNFLEVKTCTTLTVNQTLGMRHETYYSIRGGFNLTTCRFNAVECIHY